MKRVARTLTAIFTLGWALLLAAADMNYDLRPVRVAADTWVSTSMQYTSSSIIRAIPRT